jgi:hypothetical protein
MTTETLAENNFATLPIEIFWGWLKQHPNCILRAGTADSVVYDDEDFHWILADEGEYLIAQMIRGKRLTGELFIQQEQIAYVQSVEGEREGEFVFELIAETEAERVTAAFFVLCHGFDEENPHSGLTAGAVH